MQVFGRLGINELAEHVINWIQLVSSNHGWRVASHLPPTVEDAVSQYNIENMEQ